MADKHIASLLKKLPNHPGVYKFKDKDGNIIYIGKAIALNKRVKSYFQKQKNRPVRTEKLVEKIRDIEWIEVGSDLEALMLETNLIKEFRPKYNVLMKDDKNFVYIKITKDEDFPRIKIVRKVLKDKAKYFGPKTAAHKVKKTLTLLQKLFTFRSCDLGIDWNNGKVDITKKTIAYPCLDYHIKRCAAPCIAKISPEEYSENMNQIELFLEGKTSEIESQLKLRMEKLAQEKKYELAAQLRDKLMAVQDLGQKQLVTSADHSNVDIFAFVIVDEKAYFNLFSVRDGKLINQSNFVLNAFAYLEGDEDKASELLESFLFQYYEKAVDFPKEVLIPIPIEEEDLLTAWLNQQSDSTIKIKLPKRGKKSKLLDLAKQNALSFSKQERARWQIGETRDLEALGELKKFLGLKKNPKRIECYDISHLGGTDTVASMVVFENGKKKKSDYRKFRLREIEEGEIDDFKSMKEILKRRLSRLAKTPPSIKVRKANEKALKDFPKLEIQNLDDAELFVAKKDKVACGLLFIREHKGVHHIELIHVKKKFLHQGVESALLKTVIAKIKTKRFYISLSENQIRFAEENHFEVIAKTPSFIKKSKNLIHRALNPNKLKDASFDAKPSLIVIDGGKGQLSAALSVRDELGLEIPMIGLAKRYEDVFQSGQSLPTMIPKDSAALYLLRQIRDEAHRFAITFQKKSRKKHLRASVLDKIPGVGESTKLKLLKHFGSVDRLSKASKKEIVELTGAKLGAKIYKHFNSSSS